MSWFKKNKQKVKVSGTANMGDGERVPFHGTIEVSRKEKNPPARVQEKPRHDGFNDGRLLESRKRVAEFLD